MRRRSLLAFLADLPLVPTRLTMSDEVDVLLVLAGDVSGSIGPDEAKLQREGYCRGMVDPKLLTALHSGIHAAMGVAYVEWSETNFQRLVIPWTRIASASDANAWAATLANAQYISGDGTSISAAIDFSRRLLAEAPWDAGRRVIDVSGDGANNNGEPVQNARDRAAAEGITINGLAINGHGLGYNDLHARSMLRLEGQIAQVGEYYRDEVIAGPDAFVIEVEGFPAFGNAVRRKLIREVSHIDRDALPSPTRLTTVTPERMRL